MKSIYILFILFSGVQSTIQLPFFSLNHVLVNATKHNETRDEKTDKNPANATTTNHSIQEMNETTSNPARHVELNNKLYSMKKDTAAFELFSGQAYPVLITSADVVYATNILHAVGMSENHDLLQIFIWNIQQVKNGKKLLIPTNSVNFVDISEEQFGLIIKHIRALEHYQDSSFQTKIIDSLAKYHLDGKEKNILYGPLSITIGDGKKLSERGRLEFKEPVYVNKGDNEFSLKKSIGFQEPFFVINNDYKDQLETSIRLIDMIAEEQVQVDKISVNLSKTKHFKKTIDFPKVDQGRISIKKGDYLFENAQAINIHTQKSYDIGLEGQLPFGFYNLLIKQDNTKYQESWQEQIIINATGVKHVIPSFAPIEGIVQINVKSSRAKSTISQFELYRVSDTKQLVDTCVINDTNFCTFHELQRGKYILKELHSSKAAGMIEDIPIMIQAPRQLVELERTDEGLEILANTGEYTLEKLVFSIALLVVSAIIFVKEKVPGILPRYFPKNK